MKMSPKLRVAAKAMRVARLEMPKRSAADANAQADCFLRKTGVLLNDEAANALMDAIDQGKKSKTGTLDELRNPWIS